jgi:Domain of unknown function (DUF4402)
MQRYLIIIGVAALLPIAAQAQTSSSAEVKAAVVSGLALTRTGTTDFGFFENHAHIEIINPLSPGSGRSTAQFTASGSPGALVLVSFSPSVTLCSAVIGCNAVMTFIPNLASSATDSPAAATPNLLVGGAVQLNPTGSNYLWLGGSLTVNANQAIGAYIGTFNLSITYQ